MKPRTYKVVWIAFVSLLVAATCGGREETWDGDIDRGPAQECEHDDTICQY